MPPLEVPNRSEDVEWPEGVDRHSKAMESFLDGDFLTQLKTCWNAIGDEEKIDESDISIKEVPKPPADTLESNSETTGSWSTQAYQLKQAVEKLRKAENDVIPLLGKAKEIRGEVEGKLEEAIGALTSQAGQIPESMSEDMHILKYANAGIQTAAEMVDDAKKESEDATGEGKETNEELKKEIEALKEQREKGAPDQQPNIPQTPGAPNMPSNPTTPDGVGAGTPDDPKDIDPADIGADDPSLDSPSIEDDPSQIGDDTLPDGTDPAQDPTGMSQAGMGQTGMGGMGGMGGMLGPMMQMMQQQAMQRQMADQDMNKRSPELDPKRQQGPPPAPAPKPAPAPAQSAAPAGNQPANAAPPTGANSGQPAGAPPQQPGPDGSMEFTFEDGRTVKVSEPVYHALEGATGNAEGTDAQAAYEQTPVKWSDPKEIGAGVDPFDLMTGDVAVWEDRTAIVVVFGSEGGTPEQGNAGQGNPGNGTLELVVDGKLQEFDGSKADEMSDNNGEFGSFVGFKHPQGIELKGPQESQAAGAPGSEGDDPSGMANMPTAQA